MTPCAIYPLHAMTMAINTPPEEVHHSDAEVHHNNNKRPPLTDLGEVPTSSELSSVPEMNRTDHPWQWEQHQKAICQPLSHGGGGGVAGGGPIPLTTPTYTDLNVKVGDRPVNNYYRDFD